MKQLKFKPQCSLPWHPCKEHYRVCQLLWAYHMLPVLVFFRR
ncbi:unnamed protein product, partial [Vitis vinifera]|uniref:Uncharacterized protein n=1 Tax=Vitis vinifera TaxID=29760 RepID=D7SUJ7_VITVI